MWRFYDVAQDGVEFDLPEGCAGEITANCPNITIEYSLDGGGTWSADPPADLNIGDPNLLVYYRAFVNGVPPECGFQDTYTMTCPCEAEACTTNIEDNTLVFCVEDPVIEIELGDPTTFFLTGDIIETGLTFIRCGGATATGSYPYEAFEFEVSETGSYTFTTTWGGYDGFLFLYEDPFTPNAVGDGDDDGSCVNLVASDDDFPGFSSTGSQIANVNLTAGVDYILVHTTWSGFTNLAEGGL